MIIYYYADGGIAIVVVGRGLIGGIITMWLRNLLLDELEDKLLSIILSL